MKTAKKILCVLLVCIMTAFGSVMAFADDAALKFDENGQFEIMIFADSQDDEALEATTTQLMKEALAKYEPDLVVYLGDNTVADGYDNQYTAIQAILAPVVEADVPFALVFGNHDQEQGVDKEVLLAMYQQIGGGLCLTYDTPDLYGCGNSFLPIVSSDGTGIAFNLWFFDSGSSLRDEETGEWLGYDYVREDQIEWYETTAAGLALANGGENVPSIVFQHIIVPEVYEAMYPSLPFGIKDFTYKDVAYLPVPSFSAHSGFVFEPPCPSYFSAGQFDSWVETGDVIASFYGHDHTNSFTTTYKGIDITTVPTVGCNSYSNDITRGVGLITLDESDLSTYSYEVVRMCDLALEEGSLLSSVDGGSSTFYCMFMNLVTKMLDAIHNLFNGGISF
ncbi:MAG: metallophosphoesterase [Clostridia bacterium]|nr:metallophosphoesterase [Clostridia bacterium]